MLLRSGIGRPLASVSETDHERPSRCFSSNARASASRGVDAIGFGFGAARHGDNVASMA